MTDEIHQKESLEIYRQSRMEEVNMEIKKLIDNISKEQYNWKLAMQMNDNYHIQQCEKNMEKLRTTLDTFRTELEMWKHRTYDFENIRKNREEEKSNKLPTRYDIMNDEMEDEYYKKKYNEYMEHLIKSHGLETQVKKISLLTKPTSQMTSEELEESLTEQSNIINNKLLQIQIAKQKAVYEKEQERIRQEIEDKRLYERELQLIALERSKNKTGNQNEFDAMKYKQLSYKQSIIDEQRAYYDIVPQYPILMIQPNRTMKSPNKSALHSKPRVQAIKQLQSRIIPMTAPAPVEINDEQQHELMQQYNTQLENEFMMRARKQRPAGVRGQYRDTLEDRKKAMKLEVEQALKYQLTAGTKESSTPAIDPYHYDPYTVNPFEEEYEYVIKAEPEPEKPKQPLKSALKKPKDNVKIEEIKESETNERIKEEIKEEKKEEIQPTPIIIEESEPTAQLPPGITPPELIPTVEPIPSSSLPVPKPSKRTRTLTSSEKRNMMRDIAEKLGIKQMEIKQRINNIIKQREHINIIYKMNYYTAYPTTKTKLLYNMCHKIASSIVYNSINVHVALKQRNYIINDLQQKIQTAAKIHHLIENGSINRTERPDWISSETDVAELPIPASLPPLYAYTEYEVSESSSSESEDEEERRRKRKQRKKQLKEEFEKKQKEETLIGSPPPFRYTMDYIEQLSAKYDAKKAEQERLEQEALKSPTMGKTKLTMRFDRMIPKATRISPKKSATHTPINIIQQPIEPIKIFSPKDALHQKRLQLYNKARSTHTPIINFNQHFDPSRNTFRWTLETPLKFIKAKLMQNNDGSEHDIHIEPPKKIDSNHQNIHEVIMIGRQRTQAFIEADSEVPQLQANIFLQNARDRQRTTHERDNSRSRSRSRSRSKSPNKKRNKSNSPPPTRRLSQRIVFSSTNKNNINGSVKSDVKSDGGSLCEEKSSLTNPEFLTTARTTLETIEKLVLSKSRYSRRTRPKSAILKPSKIQQETLHNRSQSTTILPQMKHHSTSSISSLTSIPNSINTKTSNKPISSVPPSITTSLNTDYKVQNKSSNKLAINRRESTLSIASLRSNGLNLQQTNNSNVNGRPQSNTK